MKTREWTDEQRELFESGPDGRSSLGRVAVSADAGSGKTSVLVERVKRLLEVPKASEPSRVLCVSFTEKSKADLEQRLAPWVQAEVYTIHGFCGRVVSEFGSRLGLPPLWRIVDQDERDDLIERCFERVYRLRPPSNVDHGVEVFFRLCRQALEMGKGAEVIDCGNSENVELATFVAAVLDEFERGKRQMRVLEYNDLERFALELLRNDEVAATLRARYSQVLVDEFQDTSRLQCELVERLIGKEIPVFVVGDEKQSIYRFRGAEVEVFREFVQRLPAHRRLSANFRSDAAVIDAVNQVCDKILPEYDPMIASRVHGNSLAAYADLPRVGRVVCETDGQGIVRVLRKLQAQGIPLSDVVLLLRRLRGNDALFEELQASGISVAATSSASAALDENLKKLLNLWIWACEPWQKLRAARVAVDFADAVGARAGLKERLENLEPPLGLLSCEQLLSVLDRKFQLTSRLGATFEQFKLFVLRHQSQGMLPGALARRLHRLSVNGQDVTGFMLLPPPGNLSGTVRAMTVHSAKGLEFPVVILADVKNRRSRSESFVRRGSKLWLPARDEDGDLDKNGEALKAAVDQEKEDNSLESARLLYVAMTRAEEALYVVDRPDPPEDPKKRKAPQPGWNVWLRAGVPNTSYFEDAPAGVSTPVRETPATFESRMLEASPPNYVQARIGVTAYAAASANLVIKHTGPTRRLATVDDPARFGTEIHAFLEREDWTGLADAAKSAKMDLARFFSWLETAEGQSVFSKTDRVYPEFAFEYKKTEGVITGRIDRLVVREDHAWVLDYKVLLHTRPLEDVVSSYASQLQVYADAVKSLTRLPRVRASILDLTCATGRICIDICP